ncbi:metallophosphoesterase family protein [Lacisediminimonas profundi]|uniref:metallophosphoesterase family protein n=1 Tax=Lacisediminimonas profundi TaxID=2603856 RepID=UPI00124AFB50|nr:DNA repair exonuclease [Lacisediminimonas profundi]
MRFIHAADVHLDSPLHGLSAYPDAPTELLRNATRRAFEALVEHAIEEKVDFLVIAGDLYDGGWRDHNTGIFFCKQMGLLKKAGIPAFVLFGNHDAESEMTKKLQMPDNVRLFDTRKPQTHLIGDLNVALHGHSYKDKATFDNLVPGYPSPVPGCFNIGVLHTALGGYAAHQNYAPCSIDELHAKGYDYWALGHVHDYAIWQDKSTIVFPGNLQGRNIREQGPKGAVMVTVAEDGSIDVEPFHVDVLRWQTVAVDAAPCATLAEVAQAIGRALEAMLESGPQKPHAVRVSITGKSAAHGELFGSEAQLREEVLAQIASIGNERLWLEKVSVKTAPVTGHDDIEKRMDAIADMQQLLEEASADPDFLQQLQAEFAPFLAKLPHELFTAVPDLQSLKDGKFDALVQDVSPGLLAHLAEGEKA